MKNIKVAIVGVGNCASSLIQGIHYYRDKSREDAVGLMHWEIGGEFRKRLKTAFDREGIEIPFNQVVVHQAKA